MAITGSGTSGDPYVIYTWDDLILIGTGVYTLAKYYKLNNDIDCAASADPGFNGGAGWIPLGTNAVMFTGGFNGNGKTLSNLYINRPATDDVGFIGVMNGIKCTNLNLSNCNITGHNYVGGIAGRIANSGTMGVHYVTGVINGNNYVGGIVGQKNLVTINNCSFNGTITGTANEIGGIYGYDNYDWTSTPQIRNNRVRGTINGVDNVGGIAGNSGVRLQFLYNDVDVTINARSNVGLIAGLLINYATCGANTINGTINATGNNIGGAIGQKWYFWGVDSVVIPKTVVINAPNSDNVGGVIGYVNHSGSQSPYTSNCRSYADITGRDKVGGIVGYGLITPVTDSYFGGTVRGRNYVGGISGLQGSNTTPIYKCGNVGSVIASGDYVGGIVGSHGSNVCYDCFNLGSVEGDQYVGGVIGHRGGQIINRLYSAGVVQGNADVGGLIGAQTGTPAANDCFWDTETSEILTSAGGVGKTTAEMLTQATFTNWDFSTVWSIYPCVNGGYPYLIGKPASCVLNAVGGIDSTCEFGCTPQDGGTPNREFDNIFNHVYYNDGYFF